MALSRKLLQSQADLLFSSLDAAIKEYNQAAKFLLGVREKRLRRAKKVIDELTQQLSKLEAQGIRPRPRK